MSCFLSSSPWDFGVIERENDQRIVLGLKFLTAKVGKYFLGALILSRTFF